MSHRIVCIAALLICLGLGSRAQSAESPAQKPESAAGGEVSLPLIDYNTLLQQAADPARPPRLAPAGYALGDAQVSVTVERQDARASGAVQVRLSIDVLEDEWVLVPVLPSGTPVAAATIDGEPVQLLATPAGLAWATKAAGAYSMQLSYQVDAASSQGGFSLPVPLPQAAAIKLTATLPGTGLDVSVIPSAGSKTASSGSSTTVTATVPTSNGVQISWRIPGELGHAISRADYSGTLSGESVVWNAELSVELFNDDTVKLPLLPTTTTLSALSVDGKAATILIEGDSFATLIKGQGLHKVVVAFQSAVVRADGPPRVDLRIPRIPVSRFELSLPGKKELAVTPASNVSSRMDEKATLAVVHVPMTDHVSFSWSEAVPDEIRTEIRSNAAIYHTVYADEGVLYVHAMIEYVISRGESNVINLLLPANVQVNRIESESGAIADWRVGKADEQGRHVVSVFLDRQLRERLLLSVYYDRSLPAAAPDQPIDAKSGKVPSAGIEIPLLQVMDVQRQKGMVALLSNSELTLSPVETGQATKVGENQLPAFVREAVKMTVAHTYKYAELTPKLVVETSTPERVQGKFDAEVDTLISLGDVTLTGSATVLVNIKSGRIMELVLELPPGVSLLNLTAPSLRTYKVNAEGAVQLINIEFTQEMEGQFRLDLSYERILADGETRVTVPTLGVQGAEVEQGRIAVEALSAVEVKPAVFEQLSALDISELPQQLILKTTNPILLAYKYVHGDPPYALALEVTRHRVLSVQEAAIDLAHYSTLFTSDGLLVTTAEFTVRNNRKQFLRLRLPANSEVWSTFVDGKPEKPAEANDGVDGEHSVLIKIINSTRPFSVQMIYASTGDAIRRLGAVEGRLPNPDILVTQSQWDVYLPEDLHYASPTTNMDLLAAGVPVTGQMMSDKMALQETTEGAHQVIEPLRISVPTSGVHFAFRKLYANQSDQQAWFSLPYASTSGQLLGQGLSIFGTLLLWLGIVLSIRSDARNARLRALGLASLGVVILLVSLLAYHQSATTPLVISGLLLAMMGAAHVRRSRASVKDTKSTGVERGQTESPG
jgi:hypothetical protein